VPSTCGVTGANGGCAPEGADSRPPFRVRRYVVVEGGTDTTGGRRARPARGRPHWWAVLAVSLALMALVAATAASHPSRSRARAPEAAVTSTTQGSPDPATDSPHAVSPAPPPAAGDTTFARTALTPPSSTPDTTSGTTTSVPETTTTAGSGDGTSPLQSSAHALTQQGYLQPPDDSSADYPFTASGPVRVSASWPTTTNLSLSVTCPSGTETADGSLTVTVMLPTAAGNCQATLSESDTETATVSYSLTIGPADGG